jgi:arylsulfatase A-like enzyme/Flp pilus assembly protein TadD
LADTQNGSYLVDRIGEKRLPTPFFALLLACAMFGGCRAQPKLTSGQFRNASVMLVTIDTLRRDRLGAYGGPSGLTPTLDRLSREGITYTNAFSHAPMTLPAHASILTGLTPVHHSVRNNVAFRLADDIPTLATLLKPAGYRTGAFIGAFVLDGRFGLSRGFDVYDDRFPVDRDAPTFSFAQRPAETVLARASDWILQSSDSNNTGRAASSDPRQPFFAWIHLYDPHAPYEAPPSYRAGRTPYDAEVAYTDAMLGRFLDRLAAAHAIDNTLLVVTADHGESLGDHGETTHGLFAYDSTLSVPLIVTGKAIRPGTENLPVEHADILPTILDLVAVAPPPGLDGHSLVDRPASDRAIYFEALDANLTRDWAPLTGIVRSNWKYIDLPVPELYNLSADPAETINVFDRERARADAMARVLKQMAASPPRSAGNSAALDSDAAVRLRSLGYTGGRSPTRSKPYTAADDPKQLAPLNERFNTALEAFNGRRPDEALDGFLSILRERPDFAAARTSAATVLLSSGRAADARVLLGQAPDFQKSSPEILAKLGAALRDTGDFRGAATAFEQARRNGDQNPDLLNDLGVVYARLGRGDEARASFGELLRMDPSAAGTWYNLGVFELSARRADAAANAFRHAVEIDPQYGDAWQGLGASMADRDRPAAVDAWQRAERLNPHDYDLLFNLGMLLAMSDRPADALPYLERFVREAPPTRYNADLRQVRTTIERIKHARGEPGTDRDASDARRPTASARAGDRSPH